MLTDLVWWQWAIIVLLAVVFVAALVDRYVYTLPLPEAVRWILGAVTGALGTILLFAKPGERDERGQDGNQGNPQPVDVDSTPVATPHHDELDEIEAEHAAIDYVFPVDTDDPLADFLDGAERDGILERPPGEDAKAGLQNDGQDD